MPRIAGHVLEPQVFRPSLTPSTPNSTPRRSQPGTISEKILLFPGFVSACEYPLGQDVITPGSLTLGSRGVNADGGRVRPFVTCSNLKPAVLASRQARCAGQGRGATRPSASHGAASRAGCRGVGSAGSIASLLPGDRARRGEISLGGSRRRWGSVRIPVGVSGPFMAHQTLRPFPLMQTSRADTASIEGVPGMRTGARPKVAFTW